MIAIFRVAETVEPSDFFFVYPNMPLFVPDKGHPPIFKVYLFIEGYVSFNSACLKFLWKHVGIRANSFRPLILLVSSMLIKLNANLKMSLHL